MRSRRSPGRRSTDSARATGGSWPRESYGRKSPPPSDASCSASSGRSARRSSASSAARSSHVARLRTRAAHPNVEEQEQGFLEQSKRRSRGLTERRTLADSMWRASVPTHERSPRQLPTDHDHDGGPQARSANIRVINRRASASTGASSVPRNRPKGGDNNHKAH